MLRNRYVSLKKLANCAVAIARYKIGSRFSSAYPILMNFETWNECNANCTFCRAIDGRIYDYNPSGTGQIAKGQMDIGAFKSIIDEVKDSLLVAVPYVNGEPLLYKDIYEAIKYASDRKIATVISTNGMPLNKANADKLINSKLTFVKIAISGMTQEHHVKQSRLTKIEVILDNIEYLAQTRKKVGSDLIILLDFMEYDYNKHEIADAREFCDRLDIMMNVRPGNQHMSEWGEGIAETPKVSASTSLCQFPWFAITVDWNKKLYPCCDHVVWSGAESISDYQSTPGEIRQQWNGAFMQKFRTTHSKSGRQAIPICSDCQRSGLAFKE